jgi:hypothetical protein
MRKITSNFSTTSTTAANSNSKRLEHIHIWCSEHLIEGIVFVWENSSLHEETIFGKTIDGLGKEDEDIFTLVLPREHLVRIRGNVGQSLVGIQFITNFGRVSKWYGGTSFGKRFELQAEPLGSEIIGFQLSTTTNNLRIDSLETRPPPSAPKPSLTSLMLSSNVREVMLNSEHGDRSLLRKMFKGGRKAVSLQALRAGLVSKTLAGETSLMRLLLDDQSGELEGVPASLLEALAQKGEYNWSLMDMLLSGKEREGKTPIIRLFFEKDKNGLSIADKVFRTQHDPVTNKNLVSIASILFIPDNKCGLRSLMQLMTDDEFLHDPQRPSMLRMMLFGEERLKEKSVLRLLVERPPSRETSVMDDFLAGEPNSLVRRVLGTQLVRTLLTDTPTGKPALGRFVFGRMLALLLQGEARSQASLVRMLLRKRVSPFGGKVSVSLLDLLTMGNPSPLDVTIIGEETAEEISLMRIILGTSFAIRDGTIVVRNRNFDTLEVEETLADDDEVDETGKLVMPDATERAKQRLVNGLTIGTACVLGEEEGGPGISILRVLLMGEDTDTNFSIMRLLLTGEERGEISPLRMMFTGAQAAFVAALIMGRTQSEDSALGAGGSTKLQQAMNTLNKLTEAIKESVEKSNSEGSSWKETFQKLLSVSKEVVLDGWKQNLAFLWTAFARIQSLGPEFAVIWKRQCFLIAGELQRTGERMSNPKSIWKQVAPHMAQFVELIGEMRWSQVIVKAGDLLAMIEAIASGGKVSVMAKVMSVVEKVVGDKVPATMNSGLKTATTATATTTTTTTSTTNNKTIVGTRMEKPT